MDLFTWQEQQETQACDHYPVWERRWENKQLICGTCGKVIRVINHPLKEV